MYYWNQIVHRLDTNEPYSLAKLNSDEHGNFSTWAWKLPKFEVINYEDVASGKPFYTDSITTVKKLLALGLIQPAKASNAKPPHKISHPDKKDNTIFRRSGRKSKRIRLDGLVRK